MATSRTQRKFAFVLSVLGHAAIVALMTFSLPLSGPRQAPMPDVVPIEAYMVDEEAIEAEIARLEEAEETERLLREQEEAERQRQVREEQEELARVERDREAAEQAAERERLRLEAEAQAERERLVRVEEERLEAERIAEEERLERERQAELERQRQEEERRRQEELARQREEEERRREAEERARLAAVEAEIQRAIEAERQANQARDSGLRAQWAQAISNKVELYWNRPPNAGVGLECVVIVTQLPNGEVIDVLVEECNRDDPNIIRSIENAVLNASPLPNPPRGVPFERVVRITFRPTE